MVNKLHNPTLRVIKILELINNNEYGITNKEISERLMIPKSTLSPILNTLESTNILEKSDKGCYSASFKLFQLGLSYSGHLDTLSMIRKQMKIVVKEVEEIVQYGVLIDDMVLYLEKVNAFDNIEIVSSVGKKIPAVYTALGKALLSEYSDDQIINKYKNYEFIKYTDNSINSLDELLNDIRQVRIRGYSIEDREFTNNTSCVAVPIRESGIIKGAMSVTYPVFRKTECKETKIINALLEQKNIIEDIIKIQNLKLDFVGDR